jgi:hypothetical protein
MLVKFVLIAKEIKEQNILRVIYNSENCSIASSIGCPTQTMQDSYLY